MGDCPAGRLCVRLRGARRVRAAQLRPGPRERVLPGAGAVGGQEGGRRRQHGDARQMVHSPSRRVSARRPFSGFSHPPAHRFFLPRHLPSDCKERTRTRKGPGRKQCFEQCDAGAHADINPVASVRKVCKVLCTWDDRRNPQPPDIQTIPLGTYDLWFESGWDAREGRVVPLDQCVDSKGAPE